MAKTYQYYYPTAMTSGVTLPVWTPGNQGGTTQPSVPTYTIGKVAPKVPGAVYLSPLGQPGAPVITDTSGTTTTTPPIPGVTPEHLYMPTYYKIKDDQIIVTAPYNVMGRGPLKEYGFRYVNGVGWVGPNTKSGRRVAEKFFGINGKARAGGAWRKDPTRNANRTTSNQKEDETTTRWLGQMVNWRF